VSAAWNAPSDHTEPFHRLRHKLHQTAKALKAWVTSLLSDARQKLYMAQEVILRLDEAQDFRQLSDEELALRSKLKKRILGWLVIEKARRKQSARIKHVKEGDANTRFFHLRANGRRRKNFIQRLSSGNDWALTHNDKQILIQDHFVSIMTDPPPCTRDFSWAHFQLPTTDFSSLDKLFTDEEIWQAICQMPQNKAPGPDGFTGLFFRACWETIRADIAAAVNSVYNLRCHDLNLLNKANIILLPKKDGVESIRDFRPISLVHGIAKLITKILALHLAPLTCHLISNCQSAFIKKRSIHDNFFYVHNLTRKFHRNKTSVLLFKLDISKAFDSVRWDYLISMMNH
jgi:hypothetical protein